MDQSYLEAKNYINKEGVTTIKLKGTESVAVGLNINIKETPNIIPEKVAEHLENTSPGHSFKILENIRDPLDPNISVVIAVNNHTVRYSPQQAERAIDELNKKIWRNIPLNKAPNHVDSLKHREPHRHTDLQPFKVMDVLSGNKPGIAIGKYTDQAAAQAHADRASEITGENFNVRESSKMGKRKVFLADQEGNTVFFPDKESAQQKLDELNTKGLLVEKKQGHGGRY